MTGLFGIKYRGFPAIDDVLVARAYNLMNAFSIGLRSGLYDGSYTISAPAASMALLTHNGQRDSSGFRCTQSSHRIDLEMAARQTSQGVHHLARPLRTIASPRLFPN